MTNLPSLKISSKTQRRPSERRSALAPVAAFVVVLLALPVVAVAQAPYDPYGTTAPGGENGCAETGMNTQCTAFGTIKMEARRDVRGEPLDLTTQVYLNTGYANQGARWVMFSVRNITDDGPSPVTIGLTKFSTASGDVVTTRVEQVKPSELNLWVDVLDLPIGEPISLDLKIGVTERGAFSLETLVLAFDRGYAPVQDGYGSDASLFSFTVLGVNKETASTSGDVDTLSEGNKLPAPGFAAAAAVLGIVVLFIVRRRLK